MPPGGPAVSEVEWPPPVRANLLPAKHTKYAKGMPFFASFAYFAGDPTPSDLVSPEARRTPSQVIADAKVELNIRF